VPFFTLPEVTASFFSCAFPTLPAGMATTAAKLVPPSAIRSAIDATTSPGAGRRTYLPLRMFPPEVA
jgi:hypothetical protein